MSDLTYLQARYERSLANMRAAATESARLAHAELAALYAARITETGARLPAAAAAG